MRISLSLLGAAAAVAVAVAPTPAMAQDFSQLIGPILTQVLTQTARQQYSYPGGYYPAPQQQYGYGYQGGYYPAPQQQYGYGYPGGYYPAPQQQYGYGYQGGYYGQPGSYPQNQNSAISVLAQVLAQSLFRPQTYPTVNNYGYYRP